MSFFVRLFSLLGSAKSFHAGLQKAQTVVKSIKSTVDTLETQAIQELMAKAEQGEAGAQYDCGEQYYFGSSVPQDYNEASQWFHRAAEQGHVPAQANLGMLYALGRGVKRDYVEAFKWASLAAARGNKSALKTQDTLARRMTADQIAEGQQRAAAWSAAMRSRRTPAPEEQRGERT